MGDHSAEEGMNSFIPGYQESSPRTQAEKLTDFLTNEFHSKNILPARIFAMADTRRSGSVKFTLILDAMQKILPSLTRDFLDQIPYAFEMSPNEVLSKDEFDMLFDLKSQMASSPGPKPSALKMKNQRQRGGSSEEYQAILKYLAECLAEENITAIRFFKQADKNFNQVLTVDELKDQVKVSLPESFAGLNFKKLTKALDTNNNGLVEQNDFVRLVEEAARSNADTSQFKRISGALGKPMVPLKPAQKSGANSVTMLDTILPQHRLTHEDVVAYLKQLIAAEGRVKQPTDDIKAIFDKIQRWKQKAGDLDQQEKMVTKKMKPLEPVKVHNARTVMDKMLQLKPEIGLTDDEITIIVYTSLDHDFFTNLVILQGEFLKWFNLNFEGESREELDFLENKQDIWMATTSLAMDVVQWHGRLTERHEVILTTKWWEKIRFNNFGSQLAAKFQSQPSLMKDMRALFKQQNDKLSDRKSVV